MRGISKEAADAFINGRNFKKSNTVVKDNAMYLFGNKIAWKENGGVLNGYLDKQLEELKQ